jgi:hypothetical protein
VGAATGSTALVSSAAISSSFFSSAVSSLFPFRRPSRPREVDRLFCFFSVSSDSVFLVLRAPAATTGAAAEF